MEGNYLRGGACVCRKVAENCTKKWSERCSGEIVTSAVEQLQVGIIFHHKSHYSNELIVNYYFNLKKEINRFNVQIKVTIGPALRVMVNLIITIYNK